MLRFIKLLAVLVWIAAALVIFPYFVPNSYSLFLFVGRLCAGVVFLGLAFAAFRWGRKSSLGLEFGGAHLIVTVIAAAASVGIALQGTDMIVPGDAHVLSVVTDGLKKQGPEAVAAYKDLKVSGTQCEPYSVRPEWECSFKISYTMAATGQTFTDEPQNKLYLSRVTGEQLHVYYDTGCGYDFQWSQKLRASASYDKRVEPITWTGCDMSNSGTHFFNGLGSAYSSVVFQISHEKGAPGAIELAEPDVFYAVKELFPFKIQGTIKNVQCDPLKDGAITCTVSGNEVTWQHDGTNDLISTGKQELRSNFTRRIQLYPDGRRWALKIIS